MLLKGKKCIINLNPTISTSVVKAVGEFVGGNLALLAHVVGTSSDIKTRGRILFLEDTGEYLYNMDRMLYQLKRAGKLRKTGRPCHWWLH